MKKGRRKDHIWKFYKYKGDIAYYAHCSCGFKYGCSKNETIGVIKQIIAPERLYPYCPHCGSRKTKYEPEIIKVDYYPWEK